MLAFQAGIVRRLLLIFNILSVIINLLFNAFITAIYSLDFKSFLNSAKYLMILKGLKLVNFWFDKNLLDFNFGFNKNRKCRSLAKLA
jgi:hypothetical protein